METLASMYRSVRNRANPSPAQRRALVSARSIIGLPNVPPERVQSAVAELILAFA